MIDRDRTTLVRSRSNYFSSIVIELFLQDRQRNCADFFGWIVIELLCLRRARRPNSTFQDTSILCRLLSLFMVLNLLLFMLLSLLTLHIFIPVYQHCHIYLIYSCYLTYSAIANACGTEPTHSTRVT